jgi:hypothetical protein
LCWLGCMDRGRGASYAPSPTPLSVDTRCNATDALGRVWVPCSGGDVHALEERCMGGQGSHGLRSRVLRRLASGLQVFHQLINRMRWVGHLARRYGRRCTPRRAGVGGGGDRKQDRPALHTRERERCNRPRLLGVFSGLSRWLKAHMVNVPSRVTRTPAYLRRQAALPCSGY